ncbi:DUF6526 family protein [Peribacillus alkalitolerans]|uniref:DUF6526 family protein n=1 Tax=Peribacillus alkalitolerans TaxID=1550385 RepID=UPI0013CF8923|nr:DUF6526 family protein [Peribacillus alkalitolerans]
MKEQNFANHTRMHPIYHYVLVLLLLGALVGGIIQVIRALNDDTNILMSMMMLLLVIIIGIVAALVRLYPLKAQDRAIRAEENLRHYVLTGNLLDSRLSMGQIVALRFANDQEFPGLAERALKENLNSKQIKMAIHSWRADNNRI